MSIPKELNEDRNICDALQDMRNADKSRNYSYLKGLIEEAQSYANRMETGLDRSRQTAWKIGAELDKEKPDLGKIRELLNKRWNFSERGRWGDE